MRHIDKRFGKLSEFSFASPSPEECIARAMQSDRHRRSYAQTRELSGGRLLDWRWSESSVTFLLSQSLLHIDMQFDRVCWNWQRERPGALTGTRAAERFTTTFYGDNRDVWDPGALLDACVDREIKHVIAGHVWLRVCFRGLRPFWFWNMEDCELGTPLLDFRPDVDEDVVE